MQEYRTEVQQILSEDKQLASEIEFDLKRFDREEEEAKEAVRRRQSRELNLCSYSLKFITLYLWHILTYGI